MSKIEIPKARINFEFTDKIYLQGEEAGISLYDLFKVYMDIGSYLRTFDVVCCDSEKNIIGFTHQSTKVTP